MTYTELYFCILNREIVDIGWEPNGKPICFLGASGGMGNVCNETLDNFIPLSLCEVREFRKKEGEPK